MPRLNATESLALLADFLFRNFKKLREVLVGESILLCLNEKLIRRKSALVGEDDFFLLNELAHLSYEIALNAGAFKDLLVARAFAESFVHLEVTLGVWNCKHLKKFIKTLLVEILNETEPGAAAFEGADSLLESFLVSLSYRHHFADGFHLSAELILDGAELFKCPARELKNYIIA